MEQNKTNRKTTESRTKGQRPMSREEFTGDRAALYKWGRILKALLAILEDKGITNKTEVMAKVYQQLNTSGQPIPDEDDTDRR